MIALNKGCAQRLPNGSLMEHIAQRQGENVEESMKLAGLFKLMADHYIPVQARQLPHPIRQLYFQLVFAPLTE